MFLEVFLILLALSFILLGLGYAVGEASFSIIGLTFLFVLSTGVLIPNNLEIPTGVEQETVYTYNASNVLTNTVLSENDTYTNPATRFYGVWLSIIAGAGFFIVWNNTKSRGEFDD